MCYFITIAIPNTPGGDLPVRVPRGLMLLDTANQSILGRLPPNYRLYLVTAGGCSCSLYADPREQGEWVRLHESKRQRRIAHRERKYRRMGWSQSKIERALQADKTLRPRKDLFLGIHETVAELVSGLARELGCVGLLVHWYEEDVENGSISFVSGKRRTISEFQNMHKGFLPDILEFIVSG